MSGKLCLRYPLGREGVYAAGGPTFLAHIKQKVRVRTDLKPSLAAQFNAASFHYRQ